MAFCLTSLDTVAGMEPPPVSNHPSLAPSGTASPVPTDPNSTLPVNRTLPEGVVPAYQNNVDAINAHIEQLQTMVSETSHRITLQIQLDPANSGNLTPIINALTIVQGRLTFYSRCLQVHPEANMNFIFTTINQIDPEIQNHHQLAIERLQILYNTLVQELNQHEHILNVEGRNMLLLIESYRLWLSHNPNLNHSTENSIMQNLLSHRLTYLRNLRTNYDSTFQRLALMFNENDATVMRFQREVLSTLYPVMRIESIMLETLRQIIVESHR